MRTQNQTTTNRLQRARCAAKALSPTARQTPPNPAKAPQTTPHIIGAKQSHVPFCPTPVRRRKTNSPTPQPEPGHAPPPTPPPTPKRPPKPCLLLRLLYFLCALCVSAASLASNPRAPVPPARDKRPGREWAWAAVIWGSENLMAGFRGWGMIGCGWSGLSGPGNVRQ